MSPIRLRDLRALPPSGWALLGAASLVTAAAALTAGEAWRMLLPGFELHRGAEVTGTMMLATLMAGRGAGVVAVTAWTCAALAGVACALAAWIVLRSWGTRAARQMGALLVAAALMLVLRAAPDVAARTLGDPGAWNAAQEVAGYCVVLYLLVGLARFLVLFPREVDPDSIEPIYLEWRPLARVVGRSGPAVPVRVLAAWHRALVSGRAPLLAASVPVVAWAAYRGALGAVSEDALGAALMMLSAVAGGAYLFWGLPYAIASLTHLRRFGSDDERRRVAVLRASMLALLVVLALSFVLALVMQAFVPPPPKGPHALGTPLPASVPLNVVFAIMMFWTVIPEVAIGCAAIAVLRGGALDARVAFTRATVWSLLGVIATLLFVLLERFVTIEIARWLGLASDAGGLLAGAVVAATFMPLRKQAARIAEAVAQRFIPLHEAAHGERLLLAIAVVDISGYTALAARDEPQAILQGAALTRACDQVVTQHGGRRVKSLGDGALLVFDDTRNAATALPKIHDTFAAMVRSLGLEPQPLHSGLHRGEVVQASDGDVFGHSVNIAARLADAAQPGQILASAAVCNALPPSPALAAAGAHKFKNVPQQVECFRLA